MPFKKPTNAPSETPNVAETATVSAPVPAVEAPKAEVKRDKLADFAWRELVALNPELPPIYNLTPEHAEILAESGISVSDAAYAGIFSVTKEQAREWTGFGYAGIVFSYLQPNGKLFKYRHKSGVDVPFVRLRPDANLENKKQPKYLSPKDAGVFVYVPRSRGHQWVEHPGDNEFKTGMNILITEGEKKSLCACIYGLATLGLGGVDCYATGKKTDEGKDLGFLIEQIDLLQQKRVIVVFDSDPLKNGFESTGVKEAVHRMTMAIFEAYAAREKAVNKMVVRTLKLEEILKFTLLPHRLGVKTGLDDAIMQWGIEAILELANSALPLLTISKSKPKEDDDDGEEKVSLQAKPCYFTEPLGDDASKIKAFIHYRNIQMNLKSLIGALQLNNTHMNIPGLGYYQYRKKEGVWAEITEAEWKNLPQEVCSVQRWHNREAINPMRALIDSRCLGQKEDLNPVEYLGFENGVLNRNTKEFMEYDPSFLLTRQLGFEYDPEATCPYFEDTLKYMCAVQLADGTWDEEDPRCLEKINLIKYLFCYTLTPKPYTRYGLEVFPYIWGKPGHGKGSLVGVLEDLCGSAHGAWSIDSLSNPNGLNDLVGKLAGICSDVKGAWTPQAVEVMNKIASNETMSVKRLYKDLVTLRLNTVLWAAANETPVMKNGDRGGVDRRLILLEMNRPLESQSTNHKQKLKDQSAGIYNWAMSVSMEEAIDGINAYRASQASIESKIQYLAESNTVYRWMTDEDSSDADAKAPNGVSVSFRKLLASYQKWCNIYSSRPLASENFKKELIKAGTIIDDKTNPRLHSYMIPISENINRVKWAG
jgi:P4 family phage/plasmid primase-like protien